MSPAKAGRADRRDGQLDTTGMRACSGESSWHEGAPGPAGVRASGCGQPTAHTQTQTRVSGQGLGDGFECGGLQSGLRRAGIPSRAAGRKERRAPCARSGAAHALSEPGFWQDQVAEIMAVLMERGRRGKSYPGHGAGGLREGHRAQLSVVWSGHFQKDSGSGF